MHHIVTHPQHGTVGKRMVQIHPGQLYDHDLARQAVEFLQTRNAELFPFVAGFDDARMAAFVQDLREGLSALTDSGSARKTASTGFMMRDRLLHEVVAEWAAADGDWPSGADPRNPVTSLGWVGNEPT
jgi:hypothetical protein